MPHKVPASHRFLDSPHLQLKPCHWKQPPIKCQRDANTQKPEAFYTCAYHKCHRHITFWHLLAIYSQFIQSKQKLLGCSEAMDALTSIFWHLFPPVESSRLQVKIEVILVLDDCMTHWFANMNLHILNLFIDQGSNSAIGITLRSGKKISSNLSPQNTFSNDRNAPRHGTREPESISAKGQCSDPQGL